MNDPSPTGSNLSIKFSNITSEDVLRLSVPVMVSFIVNIIINSITCPLTVLLNVLVIMAVKRRPTLQSYANILLACLAATDVVSGLLVQPSFILHMFLKLLEVDDEHVEDVVIDIHDSALRGLLVCSSLHLMLVTYERIIAIKYTLNYFVIMTKKKLKIAVAVCWLLPIFSELFKDITGDSLFSNVLVALTLVSCVLFISISYLLLYRETRRHHKKMKTEQLPRQEVERFTKEKKALKTSVFVVGAVLLCFFPSIVLLSLVFHFSLDVVVKSNLYVILLPFVRTSGMSNSFLNPLIYCLRHKEIRKFVFRFSTVQQVHPTH